MKVLFFHRNAEWLGIEYLSSILKNAGHQTELIFDPGSGDVEYKFSLLERFFDVTDKMIKMAKAYQPDLIAFSCLTNLYPWVSKMARLLKQEITAPIIVGGLHPTILPEHVISDPNIDMICIGEGEEAFLELVNSMETGKLDYSIKNIWFKKNGQVIRNPARPLIQNLDALPFPDKDLFKKYGCFSERVYVMTSRGCPYECTYCFNSYYKKLFHEPGNPPVRRRSVENVIEELKFFITHYKNIKMVFFYDDIFTVNDTWIKKFCHEYKAHINLPFKMLVHPQAVKKETLQMLKDAGCIYVDIGVESGSESLRRKLLKRYMSNLDILSVAKMLREVGIKFCTLNMVGFPGETPAQMWETYELNQAMRPDGAIVSIFYPFPKTSLTEYCLKEGFMDREEYRKACDGEGGYKLGTPLSNVDVKEAQRVQVLLPVLIKMPRFLRPLIKKMPINRLTRVLSIPFLSIPGNAYLRIKESLVMFLTSHHFYKKKRFVDDGASSADLSGRVKYENN